MTSIRVDQVSLEATAALRDRVLRPGRPTGSVSWSAFDVAGAATFAAFADVTSEPVSTVTVMPEDCPWRTDVDGGWRLRGMATDDGWRGRGVGRLALDVAVDHVQHAGGALIWCNARVVAVPFYERAGFVVEGEEFDIAGIGPHRPMARTLAIDR